MSVGGVAVFTMMKSAHTKHIPYVFTYIYICTHPRCMYMYVYIDPLCNRGPRGCLGVNRCGACLYGPVHMLVTSSLRVQGFGDLGVVCRRAWAASAFQEARKFTHRYVRSLNLWSFVLGSSSGKRTSQIQAVIPPLPDQNNSS